MRVVLTYFKDNGTFYASGEYETQREYIFEIIDEVRDMKKRGMLPGLAKGSIFITHIEVPDHSHDYPALIL